MNTLAPPLSSAWSLSLAAWSLGLATFFVIEPHVGIGAAALLVVPGGFGGWWLGTRRGTTLAAVLLAAWYITRLMVGQRQVLDDLSPLIGMLTILVVTALAGHSGTMHRDVQRTAAREHRMMEELSFHSVLLSSIQNGLIGIDGQRKVHHWNAAMTTMTGIQATVALGRPIDDVCPALATHMSDLAPRSKSRLAAGTEARGRTQVELVGADGRAVPVGLTITSLKPTSLGSLCLVNDLSEHGALEQIERESLTRAMDLQTAREAERLRRDLLYAAAHELATPLTPVELQLDLLLSDRLEPLGTKQRAAVEVLQRNIRRLEGTIDRIIQAASEVRPTETGPKTEVLVPELLEGAIVHARDAAHSKGLSFTVVTAGLTTPSVRCEPESLRRALGNVMDAVLEGAGPGGHIWVEAHDRGAFVEITMSDLGRMTEAGETAQADQRRTHTDDSEDLGLPLQVSRNMIHAHRGHLHLSQTAGGTSLHACILLPCRTNTASDAEILFEGRSRAEPADPPPAPQDHDHAAPLAESPPEPLSRKHS